MRVQTERAVSVSLPRRTPERPGVCACASPTGVREGGLSRPGRPLVFKTSLKTLLFKEDVAD